MPPLLVGTKMHSGLPKPKPVHSALPIPQKPARPSALPLNTKTAPARSNKAQKTTATADAKAQKAAQAKPISVQETGGDQPESRPDPGFGIELEETTSEESEENGGRLQIYTDWANHYLSKSGHRHRIRDLQTDVSDGVLLAHIIQVVANEKIGDIHGSPRSRSQMIENIDVCLSFLAAKGVNIQGLSSEEIGNGNLKAILGLFFSLSRFKQQQQRPHPPLSHHSSAPPHLCSPHGTPPGGHKHTALSDMQSSEASQSKLLQFSLGSKKTRLPAPTSRVTAVDSSCRISSNANRRSQALDSKTKAPASRDSSETMTENSSVTTSAQSTTSSSALSPPPSSSNNNTAIPQPNASSSKPWRSKSSNKNVTSKTLSDSGAKNLTADAPPKLASQKSMLEKLKLFNSKSLSKNNQETSVKPAEHSTNTEQLEVDNGNVRPAASGANPASASSPKMALKGIAQRTFSRALTAKKNSVKVPEKEKTKVKESTKRVPTPDVKVDEAKDEMLDADSNKRTSKIASFIPKGGKVAKKEVQSGIPKPGAKSLTGKGSKEAAERPKSTRLGANAPFKCAQERDGGMEGQGAGNGALCAAGAGTTQSTASNTVSVQLPQNQQLHSHPNMATVAPFMYRSQEAEVNSDGVDPKPAEDPTGEDPETRRLRTVKNIADLRQNLEETMSSLRGTQLTHSSLESSSFEASDSAGGRSLLSRPHLSSSWRLGSAVPRLQAGDAPSLANGCRGAGPGRYQYSAHLRRQLTGRGGAGEGSEPIGDEEELGGVAMEMTGYMSDGDVLSKTLARNDDVTSGYLTDGGVGLYTRRLHRLHDLSNMSSVRESLQRTASTGQAEADSWDDSSSVSSGVSDNIDTDDINTSSSISSYANTPATHRKQPVTDAEKREASGHWGSDPAEELVQSSRGSGRRSQSTAQTGAQSVGHTGSWRRGMSAQVGVTSPRTKTSNSTSKGQHTVKTDDVKVSEKGRVSPVSDAADELKKSLLCTNRGSTNLLMPTALPEPCARTPTSASSFGYKKSGTLVTASGATITSGSATLGKLPKSGTRPLTGGGGVKSGQEVAGTLVHHDDSFLPMSARGTLQYRSLPRPGRSGAAARNGNRSSTSSIEAAVLSVTKSSGPLGKLTNQTDREKGAEPAAGTGGRQVSSPTLRRLFGGKSSKQTPLTSAENMKNSTIISNPHVSSAEVHPADGEQASTPGSAYSTGPSGSLTWGTSLSSSSGPSREGTLGPGGSVGSAGYASLSSMHTSSDSIDDTAALGRTGSKAGVSDSPVPSPSASPLFSRNTLPRKQESSLSGGRNTLPKKALRYGPAPSMRCSDEARDWLRSHSISGLQDSIGSSPFSPGSSVTSPTATRFNFASSPTSATQMALTGHRTNSLTQDPLEQSEARLRTSCMSLDDKNRTMSRSGSFRDGFEEAHGSSLSLVSSSSSIYSTNEEKSQSEIRKLRRELDASQEKVSALTTQLSANAHLVAAFEQSLGNMTIRLKSLTLTAEQKDSELTELRKTIELLKKQNAVAQAAINGVLNTQDVIAKDKSAGQNGSPQSSDKSESRAQSQSSPGPNPKQSSTPDLRIRRQHSSDSVSSMTSHSSIGSNMDADAHNHKKNKKNWASFTGDKLRSSFKQAFSKKKSPKSASSHSDIDEMTDSLPASPQLPHNGSTPSGHMIRTALSNSLLSECLDSEAEMVMQLRSELREKEMKLTDIRLEALSSAHQLDQLREAMNRMQSDIEKLKLENDRLRLENQSSRAGSQSSSTPPAQTTSLGTAGSTAGGHSLNLTTSESTSLDMLLDDTGESQRREGRHVKIYVTLDDEAHCTEEGEGRSFLIGCIGVSGKTKWDVLDGVVRRLFKL
uniref:Calponin-homology (CH) domain-containing protein n=1 Tax=Knipowitschia caucasica TaxID=637954 RepID=A0AAV2LUL6_KNICA